MRPFNEKIVAEVFDSYPKQTRERLYKLRELIFDVAAKTERVGEIQETLKWNQPSYLTTETKSGTTIRIDKVKSGKADYALYVHCQTSLIDSFRLAFGDIFRYEGTRAILFVNETNPPEDALRECIKMALTYHLDRR